MFIANLQIQQTDSKIYYAALPTHKVVHTNTSILHKENVGLKMDFFSLLLMINGWMSEAWIDTN